ncbi:hypothetical protein ACJX0J_023550, partial [Zea mays]
FWWLIWLGMRIKYYITSIEIKQEICGTNIREFRMEKVTFVLMYMHCMRHKNSGGGGGGGGGGGTLHAYTLPRLYTKFYGQIYLTLAVKKGKIFRIIHVYMGDIGRAYLDLKFKNVRICSPTALPNEHEKKDENESLTEDDLLLDI